MQFSDSVAVSSAISVGQLPLDVEPTTPKPEQKEDKKVGLKKTLTLFTSVWKKKLFFKEFKETYEDFVWLLFSDLDFNLF